MLYFTTKLHAYDQAVLLVLLVLAFAMPAQAQIRTYYDQEPVEQAQESQEDAPAIRGIQRAEPAQPAAAKTVEDRVRELLQQSGQSKQIKPQKAAPLLGRATIFLEFDRITPAVYQAVKRVGEINGLELLVVTKDVVPKRYVDHLAEKGADDLYFKLIEEFDTKVDNNNKMAQSYAVSSYRTLVYQSPYGDKKTYRLTPLDPFLQEINKIKRRQR